MLQVVYLLALILGGTFKGTFASALVGLAYSKVGCNGISMLDPVSQALQFKAKLASLLTKIPMSLLGR